MCFNYSEDGGLCDICSDDTRDRSIVCVVEDCRAALALERVRHYNGMYHILHGALSPLDGIGPEQIRDAELIERVADGVIREVIIATDPDVEGKPPPFYLLTAPSLERASAVSHTRSRRRRLNTPMRALFRLYRDGRHD